MRKFHTDSWGNLHDHNGKIGIGVSGLGDAVDILNEQQRQIEGLLKTVAADRERVDKLLAALVEIVEAYTVK